MKVCFARVDRIGDLILTLPCQRAWQDFSPHDPIEWLLSEKVRFVAEHTVNPLNAFYVNEPTGFWSKLVEAHKLSRQLKLKAFDHFVAIHVPWWVALGAFLAEIKKRTGVASQWYSWLFFTHRLRQKRSLAEKNEAHYNLDLIAFALGQKEKTLPLFPGRIAAQKTVTMTWAQKLKNLKIDLNKIVVIHPGMGGSARNWPPENYRVLAEKLNLQGVNVLVTGSKTDESFISETGILDVRGVISLPSLSGADLLSVLSLSKVVVAPSTGVAHLAAALAVPVVGIYSPVRVQAPRRWAPLGERVQVLVPNVICPGIFKCLGSACPQYDCMEQITVDSLMTCVIDKL